MDIEAKIGLFNNKKIALLGLGEENLALLEFLVSCGVKNITVCDKKGRKEPGTLNHKFKDIPINWILGEGYLENLNQFEIIFRTPGIPYLHEKIQEAQKMGVEISSQTKLFFKLCPCPIIGVTGTKGKGTTTALIGEILKKAGKDVYIGGNIGQPPIDFIDKLTKDNIVVLELSSFQLQDIDRSPHIAVVLDIKVDHLDIHKNEAEYIEAKRNIIKYQKKDDFAVINADYYTSIEFAASTEAKVFWFSRRKSVDMGAFILRNEIILKTEEKEIILANKKDLKLRGEHNLENILAAVISGYFGGANLESIKKTIEEFKGLEHRLELVKEIDGIKFYNDSFSTTPETTIAAIKSFSEPIILLVGGSEKRSDYSNLAMAIKESTVKSIISIGLTSKRIVESIADNKIDVVDNIQNLNQAVKISKEKAKPGDVVLLSPASASFDRFKNYKERGKIFKEEVLSL